MSVDKDQCVADLERQVAAEKERAEYAVRNLAITEKARQEELARRDELTEQVAALLGVPPQEIDPGMDPDA